MRPYNINNFPYYLGNFDKYIDFSKIYFQNILDKKIILILWGFRHINTFYKKKLNKSLVFKI